MVGSGQQRVILSELGISKVKEPGSLFVSFEVAASAMVEFVGNWTANAPVFSDGLRWHEFSAGMETARLQNGRPWQNPLLSYDVDRSGSVEPVDALIVINSLNRYGTGGIATTIPNAMSLERIWIPTATSGLSLSMHF